MIGSEDKIKGTVCVSGEAWLWLEKGRQKLNNEAAARCCVESYRNEGRTLKREERAGTSTKTVED